MTSTFTFRPEADADRLATDEARALVERSRDLETLLREWVGGARSLVLASDPAGIEVWLDVDREPVGSFLVSWEWIASRHGELPPMDIEAEDLAIGIRNSSLGATYRDEMGMTAFPLAGAMRLALAYALDPDGEARFGANEREIENMDLDPDEITDVSVILYLRHAHWGEHYAIPEVRVAPYDNPIWRGRERPA